MPRDYTADFVEDVDDLAFGGAGDGAVVVEDRGRDHVVAWLGEPTVALDDGVVQQHRLLLDVDDVVRARALRAAQHHVELRARLALDAGRPGYGLGDYVLQVI